MIQRIQSIFLLMASLCFWAFFKFPFAASNVQSTGFFEDSVFNLYDHAVFLILAIVGGILSILALACYNNRKLQMKLVNLTLVVAVLLPVIVILLFLGGSQELSEELVVSDSLGAYLPIGTILFAFLANRSIKKDEKLVRSMDRLR